MRKLILVMVIISTLFLSSPAIADNYGLDTAAGTLKGKTIAGGKDIPSIIGGVVGVGLSLLGVVFFILLLYAGFLWMTALGDKGKIDKAKDILEAAIVGLLIVIGAYAISTFIFSNLAPGGGAGTAAGGGTTAAGGGTTAAGGGAGTTAAGGGGGGGGGQQCSGTTADGGNISCITAGECTAANFTGAQERPDLGDCGQGSVCCYTPQSCEDRGGYGCLPENTCDLAGTGIKIVAPGCNTTNNEVCCKLIQPCGQEPETVPGTYACEDNALFCDTVGKGSCSMGQKCCKE